MSISLAATVANSDPSYASLSSAREVHRGLVRAARRNVRHLVPLALAVSLGLAIWFLADGLTAKGRTALIVLGCAVVAWTMTALDDTKVAILAVLTLTVTGVVEKQQIYGALGHELIWLLIASFVMAAVLRASGLLERGIVRFAAAASSYRQLFYILAVAIAATAFLIPSTSARAAMLVPVFLAFAAKIDDADLRRALALLFPTAVLLSAGGSLIGAGAHVIAVETLQRATGARIDYLGWLVIAAPFAIASTLVATYVIMTLFATREQLAARVIIEPQPNEPLTRQQWQIVSIIAATVLLWVTAPLHDIGIGVVALAAMAVLLTKVVSPIKPKDAYKSVEIELIVFLAMTFVLADAMSRSGADTWLAEGLLVQMPEVAKESVVVVVVVLVAISLLAHLIVTSRTARASVLIPVLTLPLIGLGHDPMLLVMATTLGTGFCQTMTASAKPVAIFASLDTPTYEPKNLVHLSAALLPVMFVGLVIYSLLMWRN